MKKFFAAGIFIFLSIFAFAREQKTLALQFALGTGYPFYGDADLRQNQNDATKNGYSRILLYTDAGATLRLSEQVFALAGLQLMQDYTWKDDSRSNHVSTVIFAGIQVYPGWGNLSLSLAYALGFRKDFESLPADFRSVESPKWGNGFRFSVEYDFKKGGGFVPGLGACYTFLPTGHNDRDHMLALYVRLAFR